LSFPFFFKLKMTMRFFNEWSEHFLICGRIFSEWRHGRGGHLTLQDEDLTTKTIAGWKKLNTLAHYGVKDPAVMSLIPRQHDPYSKQLSHNCKYFLKSFLISPNLPLGTKWHNSRKIYIIIKMVRDTAQTFLIFDFYLK